MFSPAGGGTPRSVLWDWAGAAYSDCSGRNNDRSWWMMAAFPRPSAGHTVHQTRLCHGTVDLLPVSAVVVQRRILPPGTVYKEIFVVPLSHKMEYNGIFPRGHGGNTASARFIPSKQIVQTVWLFLPILKVLCSFD